jgi:hypothetical protein
VNRPTSFIPLESLIVKLKLSVLWEKCYEGTAVLRDEREQQFFNFTIIIPGGLSKSQSLLHYIGHPPLIPTLVGTKTRMKLTLLEN